jgi:hypothetical protein
MKAHLHENNSVIKELKPVARCFVATKKVQLASNWLRKCRSQLPSEEMREIQSTLYERPIT